MAIGTPVPFAGNNGATTGTTISVVLPTITTSSLALVIMNSNAGAWTTPAGWTLVVSNTMPTFNNEFIAIFKRQVTSANSGEALNFVSVSGRLAYAGYVIPGADINLDVIGTRFNGTSETGTSVTIPALTPLVNDTMLVVLSGRRATTATTATTPPAGFTKTAESFTTNAAPVIGAMSAFQQLTGQAGVSQGTKTLTYTSGNSNGYMISVKPAAVVATTRKVSKWVSGARVSHKISKWNGTARVPSQIRL
jgi:hypothetical protein